MKKQLVRKVREAMKKQLVRKVTLYIKVDVLVLREPYWDDDKNLQNEVASFVAGRLQHPKDRHYSALESSQDRITEPYTIHDEDATVWTAKNLKADIEDGHEPLLDIFAATLKRSFDDEIGEGPRKTARKRKAAKA
jgi:hypothetical protein